MKPAALTLLFLTGCGAATAYDPACRKDQLEADLARAGTLNVAPGRYVISTTWLPLKSGKATKKRFTAVMQPILESVDSQPGLLGYQFASSERCNTARTLTVWKDDTSMYGFVTGDAHLEAMGAIDALQRGGAEAIHFEGSQADATWERAAQTLGAQADTR